MVYKGYFINNKLMGNGIIKFSNDLIIYGEFHQNELKDTKLQILYPCNDIYCGIHKGGIKYGDGCFIYKKSQIIYTGHWKEDKK